jgi:diguanylate cyclase (GGDEF)-like protein
MNWREKLVEPEHELNSCVALVDRYGVLHGWTPAFASGRAPSDDALAKHTIGEFLPALDAERWAEIWERIEADGVMRICFELPGSGDRLFPLSEVEICKLVGSGPRLAKVELQQAQNGQVPLRLLQQEMLEAMASGIPLADIMELLCRRAEAFAQTAICSVLTVDDNGRLRHLASPSLPRHYSQAIDGLSIGPRTGSCGTAAFRGEPVEVTDIAADPLWADFKSLVLPLGLRACWSSPIKSANGKVLGAFAFYFPTPRGPSLVEREIVKMCIHLCAIALEHEQTRIRIHELAFFDSLTRLANRMRFEQRIEELLSVIEKTQNRLAIHYIRLDQFRSINDALGHAVGDTLLKSVAARLQKIPSGGEMVARISADEFALLQLGALKPQGIAGRARAIIEAIERPYELGEHQIVLDAKIGIAFAPTDGTTASELMKAAALALRQGEGQRGGAYYFYEKELNDRMQERRSLETGLRTAVLTGEFELYYQPIVSLGSTRIVRAEALLRWRRKDGTLVPPSDFIPIAEDLGLINPLGTWALEQACLAAVDWPDTVGVAVNLSPVQFERPGLANVVAQALAKSGLPAHRLQLEVTESVLLHDNAVNVAVLDQLSDLGVSIALDDFGTGYSSLSYLQKFAFDKIKIDRSFIKSIGHDAGSLQIVRSIVTLAHSLGLSVTAEGVETEQQFMTVRGEGCDEAQGHFVGHPQPLEALKRLLGTAAQTDRATGIAS